MSKRHVAYIKPDEPNFLKRIKQQVGYKEGPTVDTKRETLGPVDDEDFEDTQEEQPTVVVLKSGDLTAEEASQIERRLKQEEEETPADLSKPIVFKAPSKQKQDKEDAQSTSDRKSKKAAPQSKDKSKKLKSKPLLSFNDEEDDEEDS